MRYLNDSKYRKHYTPAKIGRYKRETLERKLKKQRRPRVLSLEPEESEE